MHQAHDHSRLISTSDDGRGVYGCAYPSCADTEVRHTNQPCPHALKRREAKAAKRSMKGAYR